MALRSFVDADGHAWDIWEVHMNMIDRRRLIDRRSVPRSSFERRLGDFVAWLTARRKGRSWLVLRSALGRWRLAPVPYDWERLSDVGLQQLIARAVRVNQTVLPKSIGVGMDFRS